MRPREFVRRTGVPADECVEDLGVLVLGLGHFSGYGQERTHGTLDFVVQADFPYGKLQCSNRQSWTEKKRWLLTAVGIY